MIRNIDVKNIAVGRAEGEKMGVYKRLRKTLRIESTSLPLVERELHGVGSVLDVGCGTTSPLNKVSKGFYSVGVDIFRPTVVTLKELKVYDDLVLADGRHLPFKNKAFDLVLSLEVIEHLTKQEGSRFIADVSNLARKKLILSSPSGFLPQHEFDNNIYQKHLSGWSRDEFEALGFSVLGFGGLKIVNKVAVGICRSPGITGSGSLLRLLANLIVFMFADITQNFASAILPEKSRQIFSVKTLI